MELFVPPSSQLNGLVDTRNSSSSVFSFQDRTPLEGLPNIYLGEHISGKVNLKSWMIIQHDNGLYPAETTANPRGFRDDVESIHAASLAVQALAHAHRNALFLPDTANQFRVGGFYYNYGEGEWAASNHKHEWHDHRNTVMTVTYFPTGNIPSLVLNAASQGCVPHELQVDGGKLTERSDIIAAKSLPGRFNALPDSIVAEWCNTTSINDIIVPPTHDVLLLGPEALHTQPASGADQRPRRGYALFINTL